MHGDDLAHVASGGSPVVFNALMHIALHAKVSRSMSLTAQISCHRLPPTFTTVANVSMRSGKAVNPLSASGSWAIEPIAPWGEPQPSPR